MDGHGHDDDGLAVLAAEVEGRVLCVFLALYAFAVFGYVTATLATFFVGRDAENGEAELAGAKELAALREEVELARRDPGNGAASAGLELSGW